MVAASYIILGCFSALAILGNGFVLVAFFVDKRLRGTISNLFIISLATSDLLMGGISVRASCEPTESGSTGP